jgi:hypothetical protein
LAVFAKAPTLASGEELAGHEIEGFSSCTLWTPLLPA